MTKKYYLQCNRSVAALYLGWEFGIGNAVHKMKNYNNDITKFLKLFGAQEDQKTGKTFFAKKKDAETMRRHIELVVAHLNGRLNKKNILPTIYVEYYT